MNSLAEFAQAEEERAQLLEPTVVGELDELSEDDEDSEDEVSAESADAAVALAPEFSEAKEAVKELVGKPDEQDRVVSASKASSNNWVIIAQVLSVK